MLNIQLSHKYRLTSDSYNVILQESKIKKEDNAEYYVNAGYYSTVEEAIKGFVRKSMRQADCNTLDELIKHVDDLHKTISNIDIDTTVLGYKDQINELNQEINQLNKQLNKKESVKQC